MEINKIKDGETLNLALSGRLDTNTAPELEKTVSELDGVKNLNLDFTSLDYISSAGLRVLLAMQKKMSGGKMVIKNVNPDVMEVFEITGFADILTIE